MHLEPRPFRPFKTSEEYLYAMKEDLAEWLNTLYGLNMTAENFMEVLETGVVLCDVSTNGGRHDYSQQRQLFYFTCNLDCDLTFI